MSRGLDDVHRYVYVSKMRVWFQSCKGAKVVSGGWETVSTPKAGREKERSRREGRIIQEGGLMLGVK